MATKAQLKANAKYDKENMTTFSVKLKNDIHNQITDYINEYNQMIESNSKKLTRNSFVTQAILEKLDNISTKEKTPN